MTRTVPALRGNANGLLAPNQRVVTNVCRKVQPTVQALHEGHMRLALSHRWASQPTRGSLCCRLLARFIQAANVLHAVAAGGLAAVYLAWDVMVLCKGEWERVCWRLW